MAARNFRCGMEEGLTERKAELVSPQPGTDLRAMLRQTLEHSLQSLDAVLRFLSWPPGARRSHDMP